MLIALSSRRAKKKVIGLKGSSYHSKGGFDVTNANELIKMLGMILCKKCYVEYFWRSEIILRKWLVLSDHVIDQTINNFIKIQSW